MRTNALAGWVSKPIPAAFRFFLSHIAPLLASAPIGYLGLSFSVKFSPFLLFVPLLWLFSPNRYIGFLCLFLYNIMGARGLLPGAAVFLSRHHTWLGAFLLWFGMNFGLALPFLVVWSKSRKRRAVLLPCVFAVAYALPPASLIGIINPLCATGLILPNTSFLGLIIIFAIYALCAINRKVLLMFFCVILSTLLIPSSVILPGRTPQGFLAIDTSFGVLASGSSDFDADFERSQTVFSHLARLDLSSMPDQYILLPETIAGRANATSIELWKNKLGALKSPNQAILWGAEIPTDDGAKYDNFVLMYDGRGMSRVVQRIPVPYSMYRGPFSETGARSHYLNDGILPLPDQRKAAVLICYEAFLTWPILRSALESPDILISTANLWWCKDTSIQRIYYRMVKLWGRLFGVPAVFSVNS